MPLITKQKNPELYQEIFAARRETLLASEKLFNSLRQNYVKDLHSLRLQLEKVSTAPYFVEKNEIIASVEKQIANAQWVIEQIDNYSLRNNFSWDASTKKLFQLPFKKRNEESFQFLYFAFYPTKPYVDPKIQKNYTDFQSCLEREKKLREKNAYTLVEFLLDISLVLVVTLATLVTAGLYLFILASTIFNPLAWLLAIPATVFLVPLIGNALNEVCARIIEIFTKLFAGDNYIVAEEPYLKDEDHIKLLLDSDLSLNQEKSPEKFPIDEKKDYALVQPKKVYVEKSVQTDLSFFRPVEEAIPSNFYPNLDDLEENQDESSNTYGRSMA